MARLSKGGLGVVGLAVLLIVLGLLYWLGGLRPIAPIETPIAVPEAVED